MNRVALCAVLLLLAGCGSTGGSSTYSTTYYDQGFRHGIYDDHHDVDVDVDVNVDRPDRPRPRPGAGPGRPSPPMARPSRPNRPARRGRRMR